MNKELHVAAETGGPSPDRSTRNTQSSERAMLEAARAWIGSSPHGDNCFLHDDGGEYDACFCGKDSIENEIDSVLAAQRGSELSVQEIDALRASVVAKYGNREKAQAFPRTEFVKAIARAANGYGANALHGGEIQIFADLLLKASGEQRPAADNESIEHLLEGFDNMIANSDDYNAGYLKAMRKEFAAFAGEADRYRPAALTDWQTPAAKWLRQKAEAAKPAAEKTGWANPAHSLPGTLLRLADELDADRESAPFGLEPWEVPGADRSEPAAPLGTRDTREMTDAELDELNRRELEAQAIERGDSPPLVPQCVAPVKGDELDALCDAAIAKATGAAS